jgi:uncharacterized protein (TIGR02145 family)
MKACPKGWRLPTVEDWNNLLQTVGEKIICKADNCSSCRKNAVSWDGAATKLKSKSGWVNLECGFEMNGTDDYGFSALPGGFYDPDNAYGYHFGDASEVGYWWTATEDGNSAHIRLMPYSHDNVHESINSKSYGFSVRCVKN